MTDPECLIATLADSLRRLLDQRGITNPAMVGIHTGGVWIAERLHQQLGIRTPLGSLDIAFYRDDFSRIATQPQVRPTELPFDIDDRALILVDDVLYTGRTIRAALDELFDYGRPATVLLVTLIDRGNRELPITADLVGEVIELAPGEEIKLSGPEPLRLEIQQTQ